MTNTKNFKEMIDHLQQLLQKGQFDKIIEETNHIDLNTPSKSSSLLIRATALTEKRRFSEAKNIYMNILNQYPGDQDASIGLAQIYFKRRDFDKTKKLLTTLLSESPENDRLKKFIDNVNKGMKDEIDRELKIEKESEKSRSLDPLQAAFNQSEIKESSKNLQERERRNLEKELKNPPIPPRFEPEILAEEWYLAGRDAFRDGQNEVAFLMCIKAAENKGNLTNIYTLAGDIYLSNKNHNAAHLCYLLAAQHGELDSTCMVNLITLSAITGDKDLALARYDELLEKIPEESPLAEEGRKMVQRIDDNISIFFHPQFGPINASSLKSQ